MTISLLLLDKMAAKQEKNIFITCLTYLHRIIETHEKGM